MTDRTKDAAELSLPAAATIRERLARNRREAAMLRRLLRVASDAEKLTENGEQPKKSEVSNG
ncbi:hypothetical protein LBMAG52_41660 [Planctomycetia bacterium]|nr:hypothetical protein LBMAG52_41660 [Planctomycetia bacterium]